MAGPPEPPTRRTTGILTVGSPGNRLFRFGLGVVVLLGNVIAFRDLWLKTMHGVDLEIPLRAAERWLEGGQPYVAASFIAPPGPDLPFLYPPFVLPFLVPLLALPRELVLYGWMAGLAVAGALACRRLNVPAWLWIPFLLWPPFSEGIVAGNVQVLLFLLFVMLFFRRETSASLQPVARDPVDPIHPAVREGSLAAFIAAFKVSELQPWVYLLFRRPRAAVAGALVIGAVAVVTVPLVGLGTWGDWAAQIRRAAEPGWTLAGISIGRYIGQPAGLAVFAVSIGLLAFVPRDRAGVWVGLLAVLGAPSLHTYGLLFMVPAMLTIRREAALVAALFISTYTEPGLWIGIAIVGITAVAGTRLASLREPTEAVADPIRQARVLPAPARSG